MAPVAAPRKEHEVARKYKAREAFWYRHDDESVLIAYGEEVPEGHPALEGDRMIFFEPIEEAQAPAPVKRGPGRPRKNQE